MSWAQAKLSDVATIERDGIASDAILTGTSYVGLEHIESGGKILGAATVDAGDLASTKFRFTKQHVLYGKLRPYLAKIATPDFDGICSTDIVPIMPGPKLDRSFLTHFLRQPVMVEFANSRTTGANLPRLSPKALADFEIPLPPLYEQKRIAAILDQADELRRKRQRAIDRLNQFGEAAFARLDITNGSWSELSQVCKFENGDRGKNYPGKKSLLSQGIPFVSAADLDANGEVVRSNLSYISDARFNMLRSGKFAGGDFLFCLRGSLGKFALVPDGMSGAIASSLVIIRISDTLDHEFFQGYLGSRLVKKEIDFYSNGLAQPNLSGASLKKFKIFLPPLEVQKRFGATMSKIGETRKRLLRSKAQLDHLFASLQHRAFLGGL